MSADTPSSPELHLEWRASYEGKRTPKREPKLVAWRLYVGSWPAPVAELYVAKVHWSGFFAIEHLRFPREYAPFLDQKAEAESQIRRFYADALRQPASVGGSE